MYDLISILLDYVEALPPTPDMDRVSEESFPFLQRLYQLTGEDEADRIWGAAMEVGASEGRQMLLTGAGPGPGAGTGTGPALPQPLNRLIPRSMPSARMHSTASAARFTAWSMAFLSSPWNLPSTQSAIS